MTAHKYIINLLLHSTCKGQEFQSDGRMNNYGKYGLKRLDRVLSSKAERRFHKLNIIVFALIIVAVMGVISLAVHFGVGVFQGVLASAPDISTINVTPSGYSTFVYDTKGHQTAKLVSTDANRIPVALSQVPEDLQHAFVAIEDERFYEHHGIDIYGIIRAGFRGLSEGNFDQGASTITQQLLKNSVFIGWTNESFQESIRRKVQEWYLAIELEKSMTKDEILINYLNTINLGHNTLGVQAASLRYFGKDVSKLNLSECAVIAGITQNPTKYDPITHPGANDQRRKIVLQYMLEQGYIEEDAYEEALKDLVYTRISQVDRVTDDNAINSYFVDALTDQLLQDLQTICGYSEQQAFTLLFSGGLRIYSTQDPEIQQICDEVTSNPANYPARVGYYLNYQLTTEWDNGELHNYSTEMMELWYKDQNPLFSLIFNSYDEAVECYENYREHILTEEGGTVNDEFISITPQPQISLTVEDQSTGYIVAMVGGRGNKEANRTLNRAYSSMRQPGSTFKVVSTYAPAIDAAGMGLATIIQDEPYNYPDGTPVKNWYGEAYRGPCTLRQGIMSSLNIVTVKCLNNIGIDLGYEYLEKFGITTLVDNYEVGGQVFSDKQLTMALGGLTLGVKNYELNAAYATIANGGMYLAPKLYSKVTDHDGNVIIDAARDREKHRVLHESAAWLLTSAMQDVVTKGTGTAVNFGTTSIAGKTGTTSDNNDVWFAGYTPDYTATVWAGYDENTKLRTSEEIALAKTIWRRVMEAIPANQEPKDFEMPSTVTKMKVCSLSGQLPNGHCSTVTEYADPALLTECHVHLENARICSITGKLAHKDCPFAEEVSYTSVDPDVAGMTCNHTPEFLATPEGQEQLEREKQEKARRQQNQLSNLIGQADEAVVLHTQEVALVQQALLEAQQSGDENAIAIWTQQYYQSVAGLQEAVGAQQAAYASAIEQGLIEDPNAAQQPEEIVVDTTQLPPPAVDPSLVPPAVDPSLLPPAVPEGATP